MHRAVAIPGRINAREREGVSDHRAKWLPRPAPGGHSSPSHDPAHPTLGTVAEQGHEMPLRCRRLSSITVEMFAGEGGVVRGTSAGLQIAWETATPSFLPGPSL